MKGIDISVYQDPDQINYDVLASQIDFAILRAGYTGYGDNPPHSNNYNKDKHFDTHYTELIKRGVPVGVYWYGGATSKVEADKEIAGLLDAIAGKRLEFPVYYDVEENRNQGTLSKSDLTELVRYWCATVESKGYYVGIYASLSWTNSKFDYTALNQYALWLAHWGVGQPGRECGLWQYTSDGSLNGYSGRLDMNESYKDYKQIIIAAGLNHLDSTPDPDPEPTPSPSQKFAIGADVIVNGVLYGTSAGGNPGRTVSNRRTKVTRYAAGAAKPYNSTGDLGWVAEDQLTAAGAAPVEPSKNAGDAVSLNSVAVYTSSTAANQAGILSGTYYYWDNQTVNGRRRVTNRRDRVGVDGQVSGWIKA